MSDGWTDGVDDVWMDAMTDGTDNVWVDGDYTGSLCRLFTTFFCPLSSGNIDRFSAGGDGVDDGLSDGSTDKSYDVQMEGNFCRR